MVPGAYNGLELGFVGASPAAFSAPAPTIDWYSLPGFQTHWDAGSQIEAGGGDGSGNGVLTWYATDDARGSLWKQRNSDALQPTFGADERGGYVHFNGGQWFESEGIGDIFSNNKPFTVLFYREYESVSSVQTLLSTARFGDGNSMVWIYNDGANDAAYRSVGGTQYTYFPNASSVLSPCVEIFSYYGNGASLDCYYAHDHQTTTSNSAGDIGRMDYAYMGTYRTQGNGLVAKVRVMATFSGTPPDQSTKDDLAAKLHKIKRTPT